MIRQPSTARQLYAWHMAAMAGDAPPLHDGMPECGWYRTRLVKGGPWVGAEIRVQREIDPDTGELIGPETLVAFVDGDRRDPGRIWTYLTPISRNDFQALVHARANVPAMAATMAPLDLSANIMRPK